MRDLLLDLANAVYELPAALVNTMRALPATLMDLPLPVQVGGVALVAAATYSLNRLLTR
ncbi:hypothetical protein JNW90_29305 [Micromonospora sp. STR1s_5]|nr:hypothetical protein [Micromonospora sp. STR1s_5]